MIQLIFCFSTLLLRLAFHTRLLNIYTKPEIQKDLRKQTILQRKFYNLSGILYCWLSQRAQKPTRLKTSQIDHLRIKIPRQRASMWLWRTESVIRLVLAHVRAWNEINKLRLSHKKALRYRQHFDLREISKNFKS